MKAIVLATGAYYDDERVHDQRFGTRRLGSHSCEDVEGSLRKRRQAGRTMDVTIRAQSKAK